MRKLILTALMLITLSAPVIAEIVTGNFEEAKAQSEKLGKPLLVDFFTEW